MIAVGLAMLLTGLGTLLAMVVHALPTSLWLALAAYAASFCGAWLAGLRFAERLRR